MSNLVLRSKQIPLSFQSPIFHLHFAVIEHNGQIKEELK